MARGKARYHWVVVGIGGCKLGGDPGPSPGDSVMALAWPAALATAFRSQLSSQGWVGARPQEDGPASPITAQPEAARQLLRFGAGGRDGQGWAGHWAFPRDVVTALETRKLLGLDGLQPLGPCQLQKLPDRAAEAAVTNSPVPHLALQGPEQESAAQKRGAPPPAMPPGRLPAPRPPPATAMSNRRKDHLGASSSEPLPVIIIGNGPSGICLSYLLSGYTPYVRPDAIHPHPLLQRKLSEAPGVSIMDQDLDYLSEGLEGRCQSPVALLFDALLRPDTDFGGSVESVLTWRHQKERAVPHLVLGRNPPGGAWHSIEGSMVTLSQGEWMGLPDLQVKDWMCKKRRGLRNSRATAGDIAHYYSDYVIKKDLSHNFVSNAVVTAVEWGTPEPRSPGARDPSPLFQVSGFVTAKDQSQQSFSLSARSVVLATGTSDSPARLGIPGEALPFVHHDLSALEAATRAGTVSPSSDPVLIIGAGLSAADAVLYAHHYNVPVIHAFRRPVDDPGLVFNQLPKMLYPEYHKVHQMMREQSILSPSPYEGYRSLPEHQLLLLKEDRQAVFRDPQGLQKVFGVALVLVLIGSHPDLSFLPGAGADLTVDPNQPLSAKRNPIEVDPFTYQSIHQEGLYAVGPLAGDNFVRFVQGGALAVASSLLRKEARKPP
uniref:Uncharacterized protein n=1 Tax=Rangifer tarandus platyrhynchus TaxID=3082113 RepID=A0ACB0E8U9_RANTA|nr:unnamed protein product [Rangifer tarandus platyrhynchus]